jgi:cyclase
MRTALRAAAVLIACAAAAGGVRAQNPEAAGPIVPWKVQGNVYMLVGAGANVAAQIGPLGVVLVDSGSGARTDALLAALRQLTDRPVRYVINTHAHADHTGGNEQLAMAGTAIQPRGVATVGAGTGNRAEIIAHELTLNRMSAPAGSSAPTPVAAWPTATFSGRQKEFFFNDEGIQIVHQPAAHTDGDSVVFFRRSDVIAAGDLYGTVSYPFIDGERGGTIQGAIDGLNLLLSLVISGEKNEGGTLIIPGHGRVSDESDLVEYRDMVTIIRDRIADLAQKGSTLDQVKAARPTLDYDGLYGRAPGWSADQFVEAVYRTLRPASAGSGR